MVAPGAGPNRGALWFSEYLGDAVGRVTVGGQFTEYPVKSTIWGVALGSDGAIWFTEVSANKIGRLR